MCAYIILKYNALPLQLKFSVFNETFYINIHMFVSAKFENGQVSRVE